MDKEDIEYRVNPSLARLDEEMKFFKKTIDSKPLKKSKRFLDGRDKGTLDTRIIVSYDSGEFIKLYKRGIPALTKLNEAGLSVLKYIFSTYVEKDMAQIFLVPSTIIKDTGLSKSTVSRGLRALINDEWIYKSNEKYYYYPNLLYFYNGDRQKLYKEYRETVRHDR